ncbi:hypothetical protein D7Y13_24720 [Corallococcus praedator]|uniref:DUF2007 domain-containing protein n=1 Tax=Corallococcus praedator TaxID=2316724 RepID=A0ABX9QEU8_9BACT|nr:hypothetical protein D7X74_26730 [Corallococcus sp. CA047B]RKH33548.1 hypothetical protein D7X75_11550 [Corallococcus sp. CA031C]RKI02395.1 hypothetical protein D7Y13_24720 [Corallococcus praedator]
MRYCARCGSEYQDSVVNCTDCPNHPPLVSSDEMRDRGLPLPHELDDHRFVKAGIAEDPVTAQVFEDVLNEQHIPLIVRPGRSGVVDELTTGNLLPWWEILVPDTFQTRAAALLEEVKIQGLATADEAGRAAEEEEREGELDRAQADAAPPAF